MVEEGANQRAQRRGHRRHVREITLARCPASTRLTYYVAAEQHTDGRQAAMGSAMKSRRPMHFSAFSLLHYGQCGLQLSDALPRTQR